MKKYYTGLFLVVFTFLMTSHYAVAKGQTAPVDPIQNATNLENKKIQIGFCRTIANEAVWASRANAVMGCGLSGKAFDGNFDSQNRYCLDKKWPGPNDWVKAQQTAQRNGLKACVDGHLQ